MPAARGAGLEGQRIAAPAYDQSEGGEDDEVEQGQKNARLDVPHPFRKSLPFFKERPHRCLPYTL